MKGHHLHHALRLPSGSLRPSPRGVILVGLFGLSHALDLFRAAHHRLNAGREAQKNKNNHEKRRGAKQCVQPVSHAKPDPQTGHQFNHHAPGQLSLRVMIRCAGFGSVFFLNSVDFGAQGLQSICVFRVGHAPFVPSFGSRVGYGAGRRESTHRRCGENDNLPFDLIADFSVSIIAGHPSAPSKI